MSEQNQSVITMEKNSNVIDLTDDDDEASKKDANGKDVVILNNVKQSGKTGKKVVNSIKLKKVTNIHQINILNHTRINAASNVSPQIVTKVNSNVSGVELVPETSPATSTVNNPVRFKKILPKIFTNDAKPSTSVQDIETVFVNTNNTTEFLPEETVVPLKDISDNEVVAPKHKWIAARKPAVIDNNLIVPKTVNTMKLLIPSEYIPKITQASGPLIIRVPGYPPMITNSTQLNALCQTNKSTVLPKVMVNINQNLPVCQKSKNVGGDAGKTDDLQPPPLVWPDKIQPPPLAWPDKVMSDKRFCWGFVRNRKRDLDGFAYRDRFGFLKSEIAKANKCLKALTNEIKSTECSYRSALNLSESPAGETLQDDVYLASFSKFKANKSENGDANSKGTQKGTRKRKRSSLKDMLKGINYKTDDSEIEEVKTDDLLNRPKKKRKQTFENINEEPVTEENELYFTRKVVILKGPERVRGRKRKLVKGLNNDPVKGLNNHPVKSKPQYFNKFNIRRCYVSLQRSQLVENELEKLKANKKLISRQKLLQYFNSICVDSVENLKVGIKKPLLIVNQDNILNFDYHKQSVKNNVFFIVKDKLFPNCMLTNHEFVNAVKTGLIKIVESNVLCKYLAGAS